MVSTSESDILTADGYTGSENHLPRDGRWRQIFRGNCMLTARHQICSTPFSNQECGCVCVYVLRTPLATTKVSIIIAQTNYIIAFVCDSGDIENLGQRYICWTTNLLYVHKACTMSSVDSGLLTINHRVKCLANLTSNLSPSGRGVSCVVWDVRKYGLN